MEDRLSDEGCGTYQQMTYFARICNDLATTITAETAACAGGHAADAAAAPFRASLATGAYFFARARTAAVALPLRRSPRP